MGDTRPSSRQVGRVVFTALAVYTIAILVMEWRSSQDNARHYLGDISSDLIDGVDVSFYLVNTSLSVFLLFATALLLVVTLRVNDGATGDPRHRWFLWSQVGMFTALGLDDRFQVHEKLAARLGDIPDHFVLATFALVEVVFLVKLADRSLLRERPGQWFVAGGVGFVVMFTIDALFPEDMRLRLSLEDLAKVWAAWFFFLAAWSMFDRELKALRSRT